MQKKHKIHKKLGEMSKVFQGFRNPKKGGQKQFFKKAPENHLGVGFG